MKFILSLKLVLLIIFNKHIKLKKKVVSSKPKG